jgi:ribosomal protein S18 acetylase RimI-like enzyme
MNLPGPIEFRTYSSETVEEIAESVIAPLYVATHKNVSDSSFYGADRFIERLRSHAKAPNFELVVASVEGQAVGQAYGYALPREARWWEFLTTSVDPQLIEEDGRRTFAFCELMVHPNAQGHGIARSLHDEVLRSRHESRATLLVREDNSTAQNAYRRWGWQKIGKLQPSSDSPDFDVLILDLARLRQSKRLDWIGNE